MFGNVILVAAVVIGAFALVLVARRYRDRFGAAGSERARAELKAFRDGKAKDENEV